MKTLTLVLLSLLIAPSLVLAAEGSRLESWRILTLAALFAGAVFGGLYYL